MQGGKILKYLLSLLAVDLRSRGSCCLSASLQRHFSMESPQSSSHWPHNSSPFFESLVPFQRLSYIMSSPYLSSVSLSSLLGCLYYHHNYDIAPVPCLDFLVHASHSYPACSFLLFIPPLVPHVVTGSCAASIARLSLFTSRLTSHIIPLFHRKLFSCCIQSF